MKSIIILLNTTDSVKNFVGTISKYDYEMDLRSGRYVVDAKSLLGVISLNPAEGITVEFPEEATDFATYLNDKYGQL